MIVPVNPPGSPYGLAVAGIDIYLNGGVFTGDVITDPPTGAMPQEAVLLPNPTGKSHHVWNVSFENLSVEDWTDFHISIVGAVGCRSGGHGVINISRIDASSYSHAGTGQYSPNGECPTAEDFVFSPAARVHPGEILSVVITVANISNGEQSIYHLSVNPTTCDTSHGSPLAQDANCPCDCAETPEPSGFFMLASGCVLLTGPRHARRRLRGAFSRWLGKIVARPYWPLDNPVHLDGSVVPTTTPSKQDDVGLCEWSA